MTDTTTESSREMPQDSNDLVEIENLSAGYAGVAVIRGVNLNVAKGEVVALLGPNGAGKTTFLRLISGIYSHTLCVQFPNKFFGPIFTCTIINFFFHVYKSRWIRYSTSFHTHDVYCYGIHSVCVRLRLIP